MISDIDFKCDFNYTTKNTVHVFSDRSFGKLANI
jgi:hypothetical protein